MAYSKKSKRKWLGMSGRACSSLGMMSTTLAEAVVHGRQWLGGDWVGTVAGKSPAYVSAQLGCNLLLGSSKLSKLYYVTANYSKPNCHTHCLEGSWVSTALGFAHGVQRWLQLSTAISLYDNRHNLEYKKTKRKPVLYCPPPNPCGLHTDS